MKDHAFRLRALLGTLGILTIAAPAGAVSLTTQHLSLFQEGSTARVRLGHVVHAATNYNRLTAGGDYIAQCQHRDMMPTQGGRTDSADNAFGGLRFSLTIPEYQPASVYMPGFTSLPRGTEVVCTYNWSSFATEGGFSVGIGGISFQTGNGTARESGTRMFRMQVPGLSDPNENSSCIP